MTMKKAVECERIFELENEFYSFSVLGFFWL